MKFCVVVLAVICVIVGVVHAGDDGASVSMNVTSNSVPMYLLSNTTIIYQFKYNIIKGIIN